MTTSGFPQATDSFTTKADGPVNPVMADHVNYIQSAVVAIETYLRANRHEENLLADTLTYEASWLAGTTFNDLADDTYGPTLWNILNDANAPDVAGVAGGSTDPFSRYLAITLDATTRVGAVQFVSSERTKAYRGQVVSLSADLWATGITAVRMGVIVWTSTADTLTSDVVSSWAANPTLATNWAFIGTPADITISTTPGARKVVQNLTIPTNAVNLGVFIWTPSQEVSTDVLNIARVKLEPGAGATDFVGRDPGEEFRKISRFYQKSFLQATAPAQSAGNTAAILHIAAIAGAVAARTGSVLFSGGRMHTTPAITLYNPGAANAEARDLQAVADCSATAAVSISDTGFAVNYTGNAGTALGNRIAFHYVADARL